MVAGSNPARGVLEFESPGDVDLAVWSSGMIPASGAGRPGFDFRNSPVMFLFTYAILVSLPKSLICDVRCKVVRVKACCRHRNSFYQIQIDDWEKRWHGIEVFKR